MELNLVNQSQRDLKALEDSSPYITSLEFAVLWAKLCSAYPRQETTTATAEIFFEQLSQYTKPQISDAINGIIATSKWFPAIAEVIAEIKGDYQCPHAFIKAEIRMQKAELKSRERMLEEEEKYSDRRLQQAAEKIAELENKSVELYKHNRQMLEESGLPQAEAKLSAVKAEILEQQRILNLLRGKVKLLDQARILQADDKDLEAWQARKN